MFAAVAITATPFDTDAAEGSRRLIIRCRPDLTGKQEGLNAHWGSNPRFTDGVEFRFVRSEGKTFPSHRCLMPASEFHMQVDKKQYRVKLEDGNFFYLACVWEPPMSDWPLSFRIITVASNPEVSRYQDRHGAIILRRQAQQWLDVTASEEEFLATPPAHLFHIEEIIDRPKQRALTVRR